MCRDNAASKELEDGFKQLAGQRGHAVQHGRILHFQDWHTGQVLRDVLRAADREAARAAVRDE